MSYNGSGTFNINSTGQPVVAGTVITASAFNALTADLATGLTTAITKDGQTTTTAQIPFAQGLRSTLVTDSSSVSTGSIITDGGMGVAKNLYVGGTLNVTGGTSFTNPTINNIKMGYSTTATAGGSTSLTVSSNYRQFFTGTLAQTIVLPVTSTLVTGMAYEIENNSTGTLTVNSSGGNLVGTIPAGVCAHAVCIGTTLTTAADWDWDYISTSTITGTGANVLGTSPTLVTPILGTPQSGTLTNCTGLPNAGLVNSSITIGGTAIALGASSSAITNDITINGLTVGKGGGAVSTNTAVGASALNANTTGSLSVAIGTSALAANTTSDANTAVGYQAASTQTTGALYTTAFGYQSLKANTSGAQNNALGFQSLTANTTGANNSGFGTYALAGNTTGGSNTAFGNEALRSNTTAGNNTAVGHQAGYNDTTGGDSVFIGWQAGKGVTTGANNICIGSNSGNYNTAITTGGQSIYIGTYTTASSSSVTYEMAMGYAATGKGANTGFINMNSGGTYQGNNSAAWSITSDQRLKKNIVDNTDGLDKISQIRVRNFEYRLPEEVTELPQNQAIAITGVQLGAIAQELKEILPDCVKTETTGVMSVDTTNMTWHMVNAIKDLKAINDSLTARIVALETK